HEEYEDSRRADGLILLGYGDYLQYRVRLERLTEQGTHFVRWGAVQAGQPGLSIGSDNCQGGYEATRHLIGLGRRQLAFLGGASRGCPEFLDRYRGFLQALGEAGLPATPDLRVDAITTEEAGYAAANELLARRLEFDAIVAASDLIALGAMRALQAQRIDVPAGVSVVGFDDIPAAALANPPLTTIAQNTRLAGEVLVDTLLRQIRDEPVQAQVLPTRLVVRRSCGASALRPDAGSEGFIASHCGLRTPQHQRPGEHQAHPAHDQRVDRRAAEQYPQEESQDRGGDELRDDDEEVEYAHVHAHLLRRHAGREQRVRKRQDRSPGQAHAEHRQQQPVRIREQRKAEQRRAPRPQVEEVTRLQSEAASHHRDDGRSERGKAVVGGKQHPDPVGAAVIGIGVRVAGPEAHLGNRGGRVDPHRKEREPREELNGREAAHRQRHGREIAHEGAERSGAQTVAVHALPETPEQCAAEQQVQLPVEAREPCEDEAAEP